MKRTTLVLFLAAVCLVGATPLSADSQPPLLSSAIDIVSYAKPAIVFVRHRDETGAQCVGTGFLVHKDGLVITCAHVVERNTPKKPKTTDKIWIRTYDGSVHEAERWNVLPESDVALLKIGVRGYPYLDVETTLPKLGEDILVMGFPLGQTLGTDPSITKGVISAVRFSDKAYQLDAAVNPGNSGGPVMNKNGDVVGAVSFKVRGAEGVAFAMSATLFPLAPSRDGFSLPDQQKENAKLYDSWLRAGRESHIRHNTRSLLFRAADAGDLGLATKQLAQGAKVNEADDHGDTPLILAARLNLNVVDKDPQYRSRKLQIVKLLLEHGSDVNANEGSWTALVWAAGQGFTECVSLLIKYGAKVNVQDSSLGWTPLLHACGTSSPSAAIPSDYIECAELLLKNGADANLRDSEGRTVLGEIAHWKTTTADPHHYNKLVALLQKYGGSE